MRKIPFNHDNFQKLILECEELQDLVVKLNARLAVADVAGGKKAVKPKKNDS